MNDDCQAGNLESAREGLRTFKLQTKAYIVALCIVAAMDQLGSSFWGWRTSQPGQMLFGAIVFLGLSALILAKCLEIILLAMEEMNRFFTAYMEELIHLLAKTGIRVQP